MPNDVIFGRQTELLDVEAFLRDAEPGAASLAITGNAGIGKTTIWREGIRSAPAQGYRVLKAEPTESERLLSFSGLADLLRPLPVEVLESLPAVQRDALEIALLRRDAGPEGASGQVVAAALLSLVRELAAEKSLLLAVDDAQWLDAATSDALSFVVRRVDDLPVRILLSVRVTAGRPLTFEQSLPLARRRDILVGALSTAAVHDVIKRELGRSLPRPLVVQIAATSGGNALYAVEIARELDRTGPPKPGMPLPVPDELVSLMRVRVSRLPAQTRAALLVAASLSQPTTALVEPGSLAAAEEAGIVVIDGRGRISFTHPILASAVYESAPAPERRRVHRELAALVSDPEERARHLGLAADGPNDDTAAQLEQAADHAASRGAATSASQLYRRALELTEDPATEQAIRRTVVLAKQLLDTGEAHESKALLERVLLVKPRGELLARVLLALGDICWYERDFDGGYSYLTEALTHTTDPVLKARIHNQAAWISEPVELKRAIAHEDAVLRELEPSPGPYAFALLYRAYLQLIDGQGANQAAVDRGIELGPGDNRDDLSPVTITWAMLVDDFDQARANYIAATEHAAALGDEPSMQTFLGHLAAIECWTGNWARADEYAARAMEITDRVASAAYLGSALFARGYVDAHFGRIEEAKDAGRRILELFDDGPDPQFAFGDWLLGFTALSIEDMVEAERHLSKAAAIVEKRGQSEPARFRFHPDHAEAVIGVGDLDRAEQLIARLDERGRRFPRPWIKASAGRCRGLLLSAHGDQDGALVALRTALTHHHDVEMPFERARTLLAAGLVLRRTRQKREARSALEEARSEFTRLGARVWAQRAAAELARVPVRHTTSALSATEEQIARLAGEGMTNRQIADRAFVSPKTVEANMTRIYGKLGIRSRAELGRAIADRERSTET